MDRFSYDTQDPLTLHLTKLGYRPEPDYWMDTEVTAPGGYSLSFS
jgi:hypothetical protein